MNGKGECGGGERVNKQVNVTNVYERNRAILCEKENVFATNGRFIASSFTVKWRDEQKSSPRIQILSKLFRPICTLVFSYCLNISVKSTIHGGLIHRRCQFTITTNERFHRYTIQCQQCYRSEGRRTHRIRYSILASPTISFSNLAKLSDCCSRPLRTYTLT